MAHRSRVEAFTRKELVVVIVVLVALVLFIVPALRRVNQTSSSICCNCHLKQLGTAYRIWENDRGNRYPAFVPLTNGGWSDLLSRPNASSYAWTNYAIMSDELGQSPLILVCPADVRKPAPAFSPFIANTNISYFVGIVPNDTLPQSLLGGDRNLGPGTTPDAQYGFSPADGRGNDVVIDGPVCWSLKMHSRGNAAGRGNILLADGSAQQITSAAPVSYTHLRAHETGRKLV